MRSLLRLLAAAALAVPAVAPAQAVYVTSVWGPTAGVHVLDANFNPLSFFATAGDVPNGVAANSTTIFVGDFITESVVGFNFFGVQQFSWTNPLLSGVQGLALVGNSVAAYSDERIYFFDAVTGASQYDIASGESVEGLTFDGSLLWELDDSIVARDPLTGAVVRSFANAASNCEYGGTGIASVGGGVLALACTNGSWYRISDTNGAVLSSGNNSLEMFGLDNIQGANMNVVPEPSTYALMTAGLLAIAAAARRRKKS